MRPLFAAIVLLVIAAAGCGTVVSATPLNSPPHRMRRLPPSSVEIFASAPPSRPHVDVALLQVNQTTGLNAQGVDRMMAKLREKAGAMGCDAVFVGALTERDGSDYEAVSSLLDPGARLLQATCIVYTYADAPAPVTDRPMRRRTRVADLSSTEASAPRSQQDDAEDPAR